jgi:hypothetical protein
VREVITKLSADYLRRNSKCLLGATVIRRGRVNATVEITIRFSPTGPWYTQQHRLPLSAIAETVRILVELTEGSDAP